ncbi:hypothetical protein AB4853_10435 [Bradyrhizobium sp. 1050_B9_N1_2]|uniref:hypothetical protein n=1 Tax=Bradyrhizobium sp. 1050_B9_N1_2 TaxID=3238688 RepID=UPI003EDC6CD2
MMGLLDGLSDPAVMTRISERQRIAERVAEQMGVSLPEARAALAAFEADLSHEGHELH